MQRCVQSADVSALMHVCTMHTIIFASGKKMIHLNSFLFYNSRCALPEWRSISFSLPVFFLFFSFYFFMSNSTSEHLEMEMGLTQLLPLEKALACGETEAFALYDLTEGF